MCLLTSIHDSSLHSANKSGPVEELPAENRVLGECKAGGAGMDMEAFADMSSSLAGCTGNPHHVSYSVRVRRPGVIALGSDYASTCLPPQGNKHDAHPTAPDDRVEHPVGFGRPG